MIYANSELKYT